MKDSRSFPYNLVYNRFWVQRARWIYHAVTSPRITSRSKKFWRETKGIYQGQRGFVLGNGPSLQMSDLNKLKDEITIASNRIYLAYPETEWRPTFHTCGDRLVWKKYAKEICDHADRVIITSNLFPSKGHPDKIIMGWLLGPSTRAKHGFCIDQTVGGYFGWTITYSNLQFAAHLGLNPIYLIGCDHYYGGEQHNSKGTDVTGVIHNGVSHHFHKNYRTAGERVFSAPVEMMNEAFAIANREANRHGIQIINATRGGYLEAFPRANLDDLFPTKVSEQTLPVAP